MRTHKPPVTLRLRSDERKLSYWGFQFPDVPPEMQIKVTDHAWAAILPDTGYVPAEADNPDGTVWYPVWFAGPEVDTVIEGTHPAGTFVLDSTSRVDVRLVNYPTVRIVFVGEVVLVG